MRRLLPIVWLILIYLITALNETSPPPPEEFWLRVLFEAQHVIAHSFVFGVQAVLLASVLRDNNGRMTTTPLIGLILVMGFGQEVLQILMRDEFTPLGSLFDLIVDVSGAAGSLFLVRRLRPPETLTS